MLPGAPPALSAWREDGRDWMSSNYREGCAGTMKPGSCQKPEPTVATCQDHSNRPRARGLKPSPRHPGSWQAPLSRASSCWPGPPPQPPPFPSALLATWPWRPQAPEPPPMQELPTPLDLLHPPHPTLSPHTFAHRVPSAIRCPSVPTSPGKMSKLPSSLSPDIFFLCETSVSSTATPDTGAGGTLYILTAIHMPLGGSRAASDKACSFKSTFS